MAGDFHGKFYMANEMDDTNNSEAGIQWMQIQVNGLMRECQEKTVTKTNKDARKPERWDY